MKHVVEINKEKFSRIEEKIVDNNNCDKALYLLMQ